MVNSYYKCESGGRTVTVWPALTGEPGFYDVVMCDTGDSSTASGIHRVTAFEAASIVLTELGVPVATTIESVEGMIRRWRTDLDSQVDEPGNHVVTDVNSRDHVSAWASGDPS